MTTGDTWGPAQQKDLEKLRREQGGVGKEDRDRVHIDLDPRNMPDMVGPVRNADGNKSASGGEVISVWGQDEPEDGVVRLNILEDDDSEDDCNEEEGEVVEDAVEEDEE